MSRMPTREPDLAVVIAGEAKTKGSTRSFVPQTAAGQPVRRPDGQIMVVTKNDAGPKAEAWQSTVAGSVYRAMQYAHMEMIGPKIPVVVEMVFVVVRPASHFGTGRNAGLLKDSAPAYPATRPDVEKLARLAADGLTGVLVHDDAQIVGMPSWKVYGSPARLELRAWVLPSTVGDLGHSGADQLGFACAR